jgi:hypothetical protein
MKVRLKKAIENDESLHNLNTITEVGKEYEVFGLFSPDSGTAAEPLYICIADDAYEVMDHVRQEPYPVWLPMSHFDILENQVRPTWRLTYWQEEIPGYLLTFPEWASDQSFYYNLVDGEKEQLKIFARIYKEYTS